MDGRGAGLPPQSKPPPPPVVTSSSNMDFRMSLSDGAYSLPDMDYPSVASSNGSNQHDLYSHPEPVSQGSLSSQQGAQPQQIVVPVQPLVNTVAPLSPQDTDEMNFQPTNVPLLRAQLKVV